VLNWSNDLGELGGDGVQLALLVLVSDVDALHDRDNLAVDDVHRCLGLDLLLPVLLVSDLFQVKVTLEFPLGLHGFGDGRPVLLILTKPATHETHGVETIGAFRWRRCVGVVAGLLLLHLGWETANARGPELYVLRNSRLCWRR